MGLQNLRERYFLITQIKVKGVILILLQTLMECCVLSIIAIIVIRVSNQAHNISVKYGVIFVKEIIVCKKEMK